jgi:hypothetical protein
VITTNLTIHKNTTFIYPIVVWNDNRVTRKNLTGFTACMQIRKKSNNGAFDAVPIIELNTLNGGITLGGTEGTIDLLIEADQTAELPTINAFYDLKLANFTSSLILMSGRVNIKDGISSC